MRLDGLLFANKARLLISQQSWFIHHLMEVLLPILSSLCSRDMVVKYLSGGSRIGDSHALHIPKIKKRYLLQRMVQWLSLATNEGYSSIFCRGRGYCNEWD